MRPITIIVATTSPEGRIPDLKASAILGFLQGLKADDIVLHKPEVLSALGLNSEVSQALKSIPAERSCALVLVGPPEDTWEKARELLALRADLVVLQVDIVGDNVHLGFRDPQLSELLLTLRELSRRFGTRSKRRTAYIQLGSDQSYIDDPPTIEKASSANALDQRPLLVAAINWIHSVFERAVGCVNEGNGDLPGFSLTRQTLLQSLDECTQFPGADPVLEEVLHRELVKADDSEPLAATYRGLHLSKVEFKLLLLALAPELRVCFQRCIGFLMDDMGRRTGSIGLYCSLLGDGPEVRAEISRSGNLWRWLLFDTRTVVADEPLRLDPYFTQWLLGSRTAMSLDPRLSQIMRQLPWPGSTILDRAEEHAAAEDLLKKFCHPEDVRWVLLGGNDLAGWRALLELGARDAKVFPIRIEPMRLAGIDGVELVDVQDAARRAGRLALLSGKPLVVDVAHDDTSEKVESIVSHFLATLRDTLQRSDSRAAVISLQPAHLVRLLGTDSFEILDIRPLSAEGRVAAVHAAALGARIYLTHESAADIANRYPLTVAGLEQAMRLAASRTTTNCYRDGLLEIFMGACREIAVEGLSHLAERIEPVFRVDDVVLPADRKRQLLEIVDHVRLAPKVLDGWKFGAQLPYGRGVTALFFGPSGTGKTMAAMGIARTLGVQLLRVDLSRIVSKYIGDTEKNIDRVFDDAQSSGSAILIDEADALLGKRSEVKDAHDRYANIEVAYVLQRMEAYEGLAILTSNMRQNLDAAFLRRLRFVVEFPRPDCAAREQIWRFCLPQDAHSLDDAAFRHLARKIDLTGGHIRQITLRAAFIAAAADDLINLQHIADAARAEYAKLGMPPAEIDLNLGKRAA